MKPTRNKYGNRKTVLDGITFDSAKEARRWGELKLLERAGEIRDLERQRPIHMEGRDGPILTPKGRPAKYVADFAYVDARTQALVIEDVKGKPTPEYLLKKAILLAMGIKIYET